MSEFCLVHRGEILQTDKVYAANLPDFVFVNGVATMVGKRRDA
jgi:hypothetical protein